MAAGTFGWVVTLLVTEVKRESDLFSDGDGVCGVDPKMDFAVDKEVAELSIWAARSANEASQIAIFSGGERGRERKKEERRREGERGRERERRDRDRV